MDEQPTRSFYYTSPVPCDLQCPICSDVLQNPVVTPCQHLFCEHDLLQWFVRAPDDQGDKPSQRCPQCNTVCAPDSIQPAGRIINNILGDLERRCAHPDCNWKGTADNYERHCKSCVEEQHTNTSESKIGASLNKNSTTTTPTLTTTSSSQNLRALYLRRKLEQATAEQEEKNRHGSSQVNQLHRQLAELVQHTKGLNRRNRELDRQLQQYKERCGILERALLGQDAVDSFDKAREESLAAARKYME
jgi:hypothetical protein